MTPLFSAPVRPVLIRSCLTANALAVALLLSACGGGGGGGGNSASASSTPPAGTPAQGGEPDPVPTETFADLNNLCARPRTGTAPDGRTYADRQGTVLDEMKFLRRWTDDQYLWYKEIPSTVRMADYEDPITYFDALKTPGLTPAGHPKDRFHFTYPTADWIASNDEGKETGFGIVWAVESVTPPRKWRIAGVEPGSPAARAGLKRGDTLLKVNSRDFVNTNDAAALQTINNGLYPSTPGGFSMFVFGRDGAEIEANMNSAVVAFDPVKNAKVLDTPNGKVGYLTFYDHNAVSEKRLIDTFAMFKRAGVQDLILDMRYNGGGLLQVAGELGTMIAGPAVTGKTFEQLIFNDKTAPQAPVLFPATAFGFSTPAPAQQGQTLPTLGLNRVTILATDETCSASESLINGLRGVNVKVDLIGGQTCGKPYGFYPVDNCGTTYFSINFKGANAKGFGDFADGFAPTCAATDDLSKPLGDPAEGMLAAALAYRGTNACPAASSAGVAARALKLARPGANDIPIYPKTRPR